MSARVLVAAFGSPLRGDDGFGPALLARIRPRLPAGVEGFDCGTNGIALVQRLYAGYDALIVLDACLQGRPPGTISVFVPEVAAPPASPRHGGWDALADVHLADPSRVLTLARALGVLPPVVWLVGCEPARFEDHHLGLSRAVARALTRAAAATLALLPALADAARPPQS